MEKEKIKKLFSDDGFINQLLSKETPEEVQLLLEEQDVFISIKEIIDFKEQIKHKLVQISDGNTEFELTEEDVIRHYDITGKICPKYFVDDEAAWKRFKQDVKEMLEET